MSTFTITDKKADANEMFDTATKSNKAYIKNAENPQLDDAQMFVAEIDGGLLNFLDDWKKCSLLSRTIDHADNLTKLLEELQKNDGPIVYSDPVNETITCLYDLEEIKKAIIIAFATEYLVK
jgi:hypothetical protein